MTENYGENRLSYLASIGIVSQHFMHDINNMATIALMNMDQLRLDTNLSDQSQNRIEKLDKSIRELIRVCHQSNEMFKNPDINTVEANYIRDSIIKIFAANLSKHGIDFNVNEENWNFSTLGRISEWSALFYNHFADAKDRFYSREDFKVPSQLNVKAEILENTVILTISDNAPEATPPNRCDDIVHQTVLTTLQASMSYKYENSENIYEYTLKTNLS